MDNILFPNKKGIHSQYLLQLLRFGSDEIVKKQRVKSPHNSIVRCSYKGKGFCFQISDTNKRHGLDAVGIKDSEPIFKFHYSADRDYCRSNIFPFTPISFYNWNEFLKMGNRIRYTASGEDIVNRQKNIPLKQKVRFFKGGCRFVKC